MRTIFDAVAVVVNARVQQKCSLNDWLLLLLLAVVEPRRTAPRQTKRAVRGGV